MKYVAHYGLDGHEIIYADDDEEAAWVGAYFARIRNATLVDIEPLETTGQPL